MQNIDFQKCTIMFRLGEISGALTPSKNELNWRVNHSSSGFSFIAGVKPFDCGFGFMITTTELDINILNTA